MAGAVRFRGSESPGRHAAGGVPAGELAVHQKMMAHFTPPFRPAPGTWPAAGGRWPPPPRREAAGGNLGRVVGPNLGLTIAEPTIVGRRSEGRVVRFYNRRGTVEVCHAHYVRKYNLYHGG